MMKHLWQSLIEELEAEIAYFKLNNYDENCELFIKVSEELKQAYEQLEKDDD